MSKHLLCVSGLSFFSVGIRMLTGESTALKMYENRFWGEIDL